MARHRSSNILKPNGVKNSLPIIKAVTCPVCGSLCDDIELTVEDGEISKVKNGCALGKGI